MRRFPRLTYVSLSRTLFLNFGFVSVLSNFVISFLFPFFIPLPLLSTEFALLQAFCTPPYYLYYRLLLTLNKWQKFTLQSFHILERFKRLEVPYILEEEAKLKAISYPPHILIKKASSGSKLQDSGLSRREQ